MESALSGLVRSRPAAAGGDQLPNYWNAQRLEPSILLPSSGQEARPTAGIGAWGAWTQLEPAIGQDMVLVAAHFTFITTATMSGWVQIGADPAGGSSYSAVAETAMHAFIAGSGSAPIHARTSRLGPVPVTSGSSIGVRVYKTGGHAGCAIWLSAILPTASWYDPWPNTYIAGSRVTQQRRYPTVPNWQTTAMSPAWAQVYASAPNDMLVTAAEWDPFNGAGTYGGRVEVGVGAAGSEVVAARVPFPSTSLLNVACGTQEFGRKSLILSEERVAVRHYNSLTAVRVALYFEDL